LLGWIFFVLGLVGLVLPVLQGILFLSLGLYILSREYDWARRWMDKLRRRYPKVFARAEYWMARLGINRRPQSPLEENGDPEPKPLSRMQKSLIVVLLLALIFGSGTIGRIGYLRLGRAWEELQACYKVVDVRNEENGYQVELRRKWAMRNRRYVLRCHFCEPVQVGNSYQFELVPGRRPPMMKRAAGPGEIPDYYTVVEGHLQN